MSLAKVQELAKAAPGAFVTLPGATLKAALEECGRDASDELLTHVNDKVRSNPDCVMQVHRDVHLGAILKTVKEPAAMTPGASTIET